MSEQMPLSPFPVLTFCIEVRISALIGLKVCVGGAQERLPNHQPDDFLFEGTSPRMTM